MERNRRGEQVVTTAAAPTATPSGLVFNKSTLTLHLHHQYQTNIRGAFRYMGVSGYAVISVITGITISTSVPSPSVLRYVKLYGSPK